MVMIRDLDENDNLINSPSRDERIALWDHCYGNARCPHGAINCKLVELGMFGSSESSINYDSDDKAGSDSDSLFPYVFSRNKKIMVTADTKPGDVRKIESHYTIDKQIASFRQEVNFSSSKDEEEVILKAC